MTTLVLRATHSPLAWSIAWRVPLALFSLLIAFLSAGSLGVGGASLVALSSALVGPFSCFDGGLLNAFASEFDGHRPDEMRRLARSVSRVLLIRRVGPVLIAGSLAATWARLSGVAPLVVAAVWIQLIGTGLSLVLGPFERLAQMQRRYRFLATNSFFGLLGPVAMVALLAWHPPTNAVLWWLIAASTVPLLPRAVVALRSGVVGSSWSVQHLGGRSLSGLRTGTARDFLILQVIAVVAFATDVVVAKLLALDEAAVQLSLLARLFGPATLVVALFTQDLWPRVAEARRHGEAAATEEGLAGVRRITLLGLLLGFASVPIPFIANHLLPDFAELSPGLIFAGAAWFALLSSGTAAGQVIAALGRQRANIPHNVAMVTTNITLSIVLGIRLGAEGFILGSLLAYSLTLYVPTLKVIRRATPSSRPTTTFP